MVMKVEKIEECGHRTAMLGLSMNKKQPVENMPALASKLCKMEASHRKFLRQIYISFKITAPTYWWGEFDTYKVGTVAQSTSIMHTFEKELMLMKASDFINNFEYPHMISDSDIFNWRQMVTDNLFTLLRASIPSGYLYTRVVSMNYEVLRTMLKQRKTHRLPHWESFLTQAMSQIEHKELI